MNQFNHTRMQMGLMSEHFSYQLLDGESLIAPEVMMSFSANGLSKLSHNFQKCIGEHICRGKYKNEILFVPYHSDPVIVKSVETVRCRSNMVWNFKAAASEKLKRQIFTVLSLV